jgi:uncharacterized protein (DUF1330 family)
MAQGENTAASAGAEEAVYMLNALWFKPDGGAEKYAEYARAAGPLVQRLGARVLDGFEPEEALIGEFDADLFFVVRYPSWEAFQALVEDPDYNERIRALREAALEKSLLIRCRRAPGF